MSLEKTLAEIEVLAEEIESRSSGTRQSTFYALDGPMKVIRNEPGVLLEKYKSALRYMKKGDTTAASKSITEFCLDAKNLADSINISLQSIYGCEDGESDLRKLAENTANAPKTDKGETLAELHTRAHNSSRNSPLMLLRNMKGHGAGYSALRRVDCSARVPNSYPESWEIVGNAYYIKTEDSEGASVLRENAEIWLGEQIENYFSMTKEILRTVAEKDKGYLLPRDFPNVKRKSVLAQRLKNKMNTYKKPLALVLASALLVGGAVGGMSYERIKETDRIIQEGEQIRNIISETSNGDRGAPGYAGDLDGESFYSTKGGIIVRAQKIGEKIKNQYNNLKAISSGNIKKEVVEAVEGFESRRHAFQRKLERLQYDKSSVRAYSKSLSDLSFLLAEERSLEKMENSVLDRILYNTPHFSGSSGGDWNPTIAEKSLLR